MKKRFFLILFFVLLIIYLVFFPHQLKKEMILFPSWASDTEVEAAVYSDETVPFVLDSRIGYFSPNGRVLFVEDVDFDVAVSENLFINYSGISNQLVLQNPLGNILGFIDTEGFPFFIGRRLFVLSPDRHSVTEYDQTGSKIQSITPGSLITSMDAGKDSIVLGLLNGEVVVYQGGSEPVFKYYSTESRYSIAYACAIADDGSRFAAVTGLNPQQILSFEFRNGKYIPVYRNNLEDEYRRNILLNFSDDGKLLYVETKKGLDVYSSSTFLKKEIELGGEISKAAFPGLKKLSWIVASNADRNIFRIYRSDLGLISEFEFPAGELYFYPDENCFYVGSEGRIVRYDLLEG